MGSSLLLAVVFVFDLIAFVLAVAAEQRRASASLAEDSYCVYDSDIATWFGIGSLMFLSASQLHIMCASHRLCCGRALMPGPLRTCSTFLFIISWITFFIAGSCLVAGSVRNAYHTKYSEHTSCETLRKGVFGAAAAFIVFTAIFSELFYVSYSKMDEKHVSNYVDTGLRMEGF